MASASSAGLVMASPSGGVLNKSPGKGSSAPNGRGIVQALADTSVNRSLEERRKSNETVEVALARLRLFLSPHAAGNNTNATSGSCSGITISDEEHSINADEAERNEATYEQETTPTPPRSGEVATVRPLSPISREFCRVKYLLQASLPGFEVKDNVMIWDMRNPELIAKYEEYTSGFLELDSWVAVQELGPENDMQDVYSCGFSSPKKGKSSNSRQKPSMKFTTGNLIMENHSNKSGQCQYVLCKVAVGRSYVVSNESETSHLPAGYNSFKIQRPKHESNSNGAARGFYHEYVLQNNLQIMPQYMVQFGYAPFKAESTPKCALCEKKVATVYCKPCDAVLCAGCDTEMHSTNKLMGRHKRSALGGNSSSMSDKDFVPASRDVNSFCSKHKDINVEFYCPTCSTPVCVHCKMVGDHSCGEAANHRLVSIYDAYLASIGESSRPDPLIDSRSNVIKNKLRTIHDRTAEIQKNDKNVEKKIRQCMNEALGALKAQTNSKLKMLQGEELELCRQSEHIKWAEGFLCQQRRVLDPVHFLDAWNHHKVLRSELRDFPVVYLPTAEQVKADIQLIGRLQVIAGEEQVESLDGNSSHGNTTTSSRKSITLLKNNQSSASSSSLMKRLLISNNSNQQEDIANNALSNNGPEFDGNTNTNHHPHSTHSMTTTNRVNNMLSPKSSQLIQKVKSELSKGTSISMNSRNTFIPQKTKRGNLGRRPSASSLVEGLQHLNLGDTTLRGGNQANTHRRQKTFNDEWTQKIRQEMTQRSPH